MRTLSMPHDRIRLRGQRLVFADIAATALRLVAAWRARGRQHRLLSELDDRLLRDIGLDRGDIARATMKHFWQR